MYNEIVNSMMNVLGAIRLMKFFRGIGRDKAMKKISLGLTIIVVSFLLLTSTALAATIIDDFNDGNTNGWWFGPSHKDPSVYGNWRVENGVLLQDVGGDGFSGLLENLYISNQVVETQLKPVGPAGYDGIIVWYQDVGNYVWVSVYPGAGGLGAIEWIDGVDYGALYPYYLTYNDNLWYKLRVEADSTSGDLVVYLDDVYVFTYHTTTPTRIGRTGIMNGNGLGYFDDFTVYSNDVPPTIDIKPGDNNNAVNLKGMKNISVAMWSTPNFSAPSQIDRTSLTFGKTGDENSLLSCVKKSKDVNGDGLVDLVCTFDVKSTGFQCGDTQGILKGKMNLTGISFEEKQEITVSPCK